MPPHIQVLLIGTELLDGSTLDTNSHYLCQKLTKEGYSIQKKNLRS